MNNIYIHIISFLWCGLVFANPTHSIIESDLEFPWMSVFISKDSLTTKKSDTTNNQKPATQN